MARRKDEDLVYGLNAARSIHASRPGDIVRAYVTKATIREVDALLKDLAGRRRAYHVVPKEELDAVSGSLHHEGICLLVKAREPVPLPGLFKGHGARCLVGLEGVKNPHNFGAVFRTAAHFGVPGVISRVGSPRLQGAALRTAEGGGERVASVTTADWNVVLEEASTRGFHVIAATQRGEDSLYDTELPARSVFLFGAEADGLPEELQQAAGRRLRIPGTGAVDSLNVSVSVAVCLGEWWRQHLKASH